MAETGELAPVSPSVVLKFEVNESQFLSDERAGWPSAVHRDWNPTMYLLSFLSQAAVKLEFEGAMIDLAEQDPSVPFLLADLRAALQAEGNHKIRDHPYLEGSFFLDVRGEAVILNYSGPSTEGRPVSVAAMRSAWEGAVEEADERIREWIAREMPASLDDPTIGPWLRGESPLPTDLTW